MFERILNTPGDIVLNCNFSSRLSDDTAKKKNYLKNIGDFLYLILSFNSIKIKMISLSIYYFKWRFKKGSAAYPGNDSSLNATDYFKISTYKFGFYYPKRDLFPRHKLNKDERDFTYRPEGMKQKWKPRHVVLFTRYCSLARSSSHG